MSVVQQYSTRCVQYSSTALDVCSTAPGDDYSMSVVQAAREWSLEVGTVQQWDSSTAVGQQYSGWDSSTAMGQQYRRHDAAPHKTGNGQTMRSALCQLRLGSREANTLFIDSSSRRTQSLGQASH